MSTDNRTDARGAQRYRPEKVDAFASTVISVLRGRQVVSFEGLRQFVLDHMERAVLNRGSFSPEALLVELRGHRLMVDEIIDHYVPTVARMLGVQWEEDQISFADVTIGTMRLQALVSVASMSPCFDRGAGVTCLNALVLVPQGEQHFLGASVLAGQLRRINCDVQMSYDEDMQLLTARLMREVPDLVLISCARRETLESVADTVQTIRSVMADNTVVAVGGTIKMSPEAIAERTGADIVTNVAGEAVAFYTDRAKKRRPS